MTRGEQGNILLTEEELVPMQREVPEHLWSGVRMHIEHGLEVGGFLTSVMENNLTEAIKRADYVNLHCLRAIVDWFLMYAPAPCWGSPEKVKAWREKVELRAYDYNVKLVKGLAE